MAKLLEVNNLKTQFFTQDGVVHAVNGISYTVDKGETLAIVGESGCGKSVSVMSLIRLIPQPPGKIVDGEVWFEGQDLLKLKEDELRQIRGNKIAMIFQDPMTSLNPVLTIGRQITEALELHLGMNKEQSRKRAVQLLEMVGIPGADARLNDYPHQFSGGMRQRVMIAMGLSCDPQLLDRGRADHGAGCDDPGADRGSGGASEGRAGHGHHLDHPRSGRGRRHGRARDRDVRRLHHRGSGASTICTPSPMHPYTLGLLRSIPRLDLGRQKRLVPVEGLPPDLLELPDQCPFAPRCGFAIDKCWNENPPLHDGWRRGIRPPAGWIFRA